MTKYHLYGSHTIEQNINGLFVCFVVNHGYFKADTLKGIKKLLRGITE